MVLPRAVLAALLALAVFVASPAVVAAHSELLTSTPADGEVLSAGPDAITGDFSAPVDPERSSMELRGPDGTLVARGGVPDGGSVTQMTILEVPDLGPGTYTVRWTTVATEEEHAGHVVRGTFEFTVAPAVPSPTPAPAPAPLPAGGLADVVVPLVVLGVVLAGGTAWLAVLMRRRG
jgi:methionine-rich copper-binding protein CopC